MPRGAHWQLGKAERRGGAAKWIMRRLVLQFGASSADEMDLITVMTAHAENTFVRRSGAAPTQSCVSTRSKAPGPWRTNRAWTCFG